MVSRCRQVMFKTEAHERKSLKWWYDKRHDIDLDPIYQRRGGLWLSKEKAYLIDSILNGYDIPKIYLADFAFGHSPLNVKKRMYAIIDGKQRFEAVFDFFDDKLPLDSEFKYDRDPSLDLRGLCYSDLRSRYPAVCGVFDDYEPAVVSVVTNEKGKIEDLFIRLNKTTRALSGAEQRNAMPGMVPVLTRELAEHPFFQSKISFQVRRYQDRNAATKLLLVEHTGELVSVKKGDLDRFTAQVKAEKGPDTQPYRQTATRVRRVLDAMAKVFDQGDDLLGAAGIVPVYYWLARDLDPEYTQSLRPFLDEFERKRRQNDKRSEEGTNGVDKNLLQYSKARRSPMDKGALLQLCNVLERHFREFVER